MIEYILLIFLLLIGGSSLQMAGLSNTGLLLFVFFLSLPSIYAMVTGAPYVPSDRSTVRKMIQLASIQKGECVIDIGCGDGRLVRAASQRGAKAIGYEISVFLYGIARFLTRGQGDIRYRSFWKTDLSEADVLFCYQLPKIEKKFMNIIWPSLKPGCRIIVNTFELRSLSPERVDGHVYLYIKN